MPLQNRPTVGEWYQTAGGEIFEVVAFDAEDETVAIQYFDGAVEELDLESWLELAVDNAEAPEDWSGSLDLMNEDYGVDLDRPASPEPRSPLDDIDGI